MRGLREFILQKVRAQETILKALVLSTQGM